MSSDEKKGARRPLPPPPRSRGAASPTDVLKSGPKVATPSKAPQGKSSPDPGATAKLSVPKKTQAMPRPAPKPKAATAILLTTVRSHWAGRVANVETIPGGESLIAVVLPPKFKASKKAIGAVASNARAAAGMRVPGVLQYVDVLRFEDGTIGIGYRPVEGKKLRSLREMVLRTPPGVNQSVAILRQMLHTLASLHEAGILHGALTLDAVLVDGDDRVSLADFGLSKLVGDQRHPDFDDALRPHTPERVLGLEDDMEDAYLWGVVAYRLFARKEPFSGGSFDDIRRRHAIEDAQPLRALNPEVPPELAAVVERCLVKEPGDRYASMAALERAFVGAQAGAGIRTKFDELGLVDEDAEISNSGLINAASLAKKAAAAEATPMPVATHAGGAFTAEAAAQRAAEDEARLQALVGNGIGDPPPSAEEGKDTGLAAAVAATGASAAAVAPEPDSVRSDFTAAPPVKPVDEEGGERSPLVYLGVAAVALLLIGGAVWALRPGTEGGEVEDETVVANESSNEAATKADAAPEKKPKEQPIEPSPVADDDDGVVLEGGEALADTGTDDGELADGTLEGDTGTDDGALEDETGGEEAQPTETGAGTPSGGSGGGSGGGDGDGDDGEAADDDGGGEPADSTASASELIRRADAAAKSGRKGSAISLYNQALSKEPRSKKALLGLGDLYFNRSDYKRAAKYFGRAAGVAPGDANVRISLGDSYYKLGRYADAKKQYQKAKSLGSSAAGRRLEKVNTKLGG